MQSATNSTGISRSEKSALGDGGDALASE